MVGLKCLGSRLSNEILLFSFFQLNKEAADADVGGKMESLDGQHSTRVSILASRTSCPRFDSQKVFRGKKLLMFQRIINGAAQRKVRSGLKMLNEPF